MTNSNVFDTKAEYDPSLCQFLIDNGFDHGLLTNLIPARGSWVLVDIASKMMGHIDYYKRTYCTGCIFTLPARGFYPNNDKMSEQIAVFYTPISSGEIRRKVALKAFL